MRFKLDENLGRRVEHLVRAAGHDVETVASEGIMGSADAVLLRHCRNEDRCLVTLDKEFGNPLTYPLADHRGVVLLRVPPRAAMTELEEAVAAFLRVVASMEAPESLCHRLFIAQPNRVREYSPPSSDQ